VRPTVTDVPRLCVSVSVEHKRFRFLTYDMINLSFLIMLIIMMMMMIIMIIMTIIICMYVLHSVIFSFHGN